MPFPPTNLAPCQSWLNTPIGYVNLCTVSHVAFVTGVSGGNPTITMDPAVWWGIAQSVRQVWIWQHTEKLNAGEIKVLNSPGEAYADCIAKDLRFTV